MNQTRVLVVDDDFRVAAVHSAAVDAVAGCTVVARAATLAQARAALPGVDLVVADVYLPDGSGLDLIGAGDAAVLVVSAADDLATARRALLRGAIGYIVKPFDLAVLTQRVADFRRFEATLGRLAHLDQAGIDAATALLRPRAGRAAAKGRSTPTGEAIAHLLASAGEPLTALAVAEAIGISRATAQRYLSELVDAGRARLALRYGAAGRPEHSYSWVG